MKIRILPILLLLGLLNFGLTQSDPTQASSLKTNNQVLAVANTPGFTPAVKTATPALTMPAVTPTVQSAQTGQAKTPPVSSSPAQTVTPSATTLNAALKIEKGVISVGPAFEQFLEEAGAVVPTPDNLAAADANADAGTGVVEKVSQAVVAEQTQVYSAYGQFDLSRLRLINLLPAATLHTASLDGQTAAETVAVSSQFTLGASGVIPDATARALAAEKSAPKLWPVKGPITSIFGPRQTLVIPAVTDSAAGKGGAGPTGSASGLTVTLPALTPVSSTPASATTTAAVTPTPAPTKPVTTATATTPAQSTPGPASQDASPAARPTITPTVTAEPALSPLPVTTTPAPSTTPPLTPTATPTGPTTATVTITVTPSISATATVSPTVTPTATPFPTGPIPLINGFLPGVGADEEYHTGLDIAVPEGTEVHATADGVVVYAGNGGGYGRVVFIQHADGFMTVYGHNSKLLVKEGEKVKAGQTISLSGSTGYSTGPHVHYEVRYNGKIVNPAYFLGLKA